MKCAWHTPAKVIAGLFVAALYAMPQAYTISARPGVVNYIEGDVYLDASHLTGKKNVQTFLSANDTLSTDVGKAEVLLTPGVFLRIGDNSEIRMISPSLTDTRVEVTKGEAMLEIAELVKENNIEIVDHGATIRMQKTGLYKFTGDNPPTAAVIEGKADVVLGDKKAELGKDRELILSDSLKPEKFDAKKEDDLYAWSHVRDEYVSAASYAAAKTVNVNNYFDGGGWGYGFGNGYGPGWFWNNSWNSWAWLPGMGGYFSPFGFGYFSPGVIGYAPIIYAPVVGGGGRPVAVPVNPKNPPVIGATVHSPAMNSWAATRQGASPILTANGAPWHGHSIGGSTSGTHSGTWSAPSSRASSYTAPSGNISSASQSAGSYSSAHSSSPGFSSAPSGHMSGGAPSSGGGRR